MPVSQVFREKGIPTGRSTSTKAKEAKASSCGLKQTWESSEDGVREEGRGPIIKFCRPE